MRIIQLNEEKCDRYMNQIAGFIHKSMNRGCEKEWFSLQDAMNKVFELKHYLNENKAFSFLALDEEPSGFIWAYPYGNYDSVYLSIIYVDDACRGKSVGKQMINVLETYVKSKGYDKIWLHTDANNDVSRAFYSAVGYEEERIQLSKRL